MDLRTIEPENEITIQIHFIYKFQTKNVIRDLFFYSLIFFVFFFWLKHVWPTEVKNDEKM